MTHEEKIAWMAVWASKNKCTLDLEGECGFGRECVGVSRDNSYPSFNWFDDDCNQADSNGDVWCPRDAYRKSPCVAVLGRGEAAVNQLYQWLKWFDENGFHVESTLAAPDPRLPIEMVAIMGKLFNVRMVKAVQP